jgi:hypothetical protein
MRDEATSHSGSAVLDDPERKRATPETDERARAYLIRHGWIVCDEGDGNWTAQPPQEQEWFEPSETRRADVFMVSEALL